MIVWSGLLRPAFARCIGVLYNWGMDFTATASDLLDLVSLVVRDVSDHRDLSLTAVAVLGSLDRSGPERITTLAAAEGVSQPSMTQLMQRLEQRGLVTRTSDPSDGRVALVSVTAEGHAALAARRRRNAGRIAELLADLPESDAEALAAALKAALPGIRSAVSNRAQAAGDSQGTGRADAGSTGRRGSDSENEVRAAAAPGR
jgi:DNA-binding MarR family transcriptional regulator